MGITNKDLDSKLDKIHGRINGLVDTANENRVGIAKLVEHVNTQNGRIDALEGDVRGLDGTCREHEGVLTDITNELRNFGARFSDFITTEKADKKKAAESAKMREERRWEIRKIIFNHSGELITGSVVGIILLAARFIWGR
jgi:uncharacterized coiled-coil DUF342 family protein